MGGDLEAERRAIAAELPAVIERLKSRASRAGVVSQRVFVSEAARLGLTTDEQRRGLRNGLAAVGIHVKAPRRTPEPKLQPKSKPSSMLRSSALLNAPRTSVTEPVATPTAPSLVPSEAAKRLALARRMLARYADSDGTVSRLARDGVARLHGLCAAETRELTADFPVTRPLPVRAASVPVASSTSAKPSSGKKRDRVAVSAVEAQHADAVRAARAVLEEDRWRRDQAKTLLKAEEEVGLAVLLRGGTGDLGRDIPEEEIAGISRTGEQWRAYECLVLHNQRLVWKIARHYEGYGLDSDDLDQHGMLGLLRAARKFDAAKGFKFSTYATWWIKQSISRAIADEGTTIRIPVHFRERVSKVANAERKLLNEGRPRTVDNVAYATGLTFAQVEEVRKISRPTDSLDRIIGDDTALGDLIIGPSRFPGPLVVVLRKELQARVRLALEGLVERERHVLIRRTGLDGDEPATLEELGAVFGVTRERIRQVESKAKAKFRGQAILLGLLPAHRALR
ncbi:RNA polymerase sigma factor RpoD/SigA [Streptomyces sp. NBC_00134]|uniref:sigma-70 family RNA polymerase sigma factor n=1 Tax=Streptomyces sp. NBC_00134 TaxID=2975663 RepID=UPI003249E723